MPNPKLEDLLNLALDATNEEKEKSQLLAAGYSPSAKSWELIVKYNGDLERLSSDVISIEPLINGYCIAKVREDFIAAFSALDEVEYVEMPKRIYFQ